MAESTRGFRSSMASTSLVVAYFATMAHASPRLTLSKGPSDGTLRWLLQYQRVPFSEFGHKAEEKWDLIGARSIITVAMLVGLVGSLSAALNALNPIPATGGGGTPLLLRLVGLLDAILVIVGHPASSLQVFA